MLDEEVRVITGFLHPDRISTSYLERQNLSTRVGMGGFTRLANGFSMKFENHAAAIALHVTYVNFGRPLESLAHPYPRTPAMAAGLADHIWRYEEIAALLSSVAILGRSIASPVEQVYQGPMMSGLSAGKVLARKRLLGKMRASRTSGHPVELTKDEYRVMFDRMTQRHLGMSASQFLKQMAAGTLPDSDIAEYLVSLAGGPATR